MKNTLQSVNAAWDMPPLGRDVDEVPRGVICAANEERFTATHFSEPLTVYATGWRAPENLDDLLESLFPSVEVGRRFEFKSATNSEEFLSEVDDVRAIGAEFKRIEYKGSTVNEKTLNKGLSIALDTDELDLPGAEERAVRRLLARLKRNDLRRGIALLDAAAANANLTWNASADPDLDIRSARITAANKNGVGANVVAYGEAAWQKRLESYSAPTRANTGVAAAALLRDLDGVARFVGADRALEIRARYQSTATAKTAIVPAVVYVYMAEAGASKDDPSNVKRFVTPTVSGRYRVYREERTKSVVISVEHYSNIVITSTLGIEKRTIA